MNMIIEKHQKELKDVFIKYNTVFAYLFGSRATGKQVKKSDFDIAVMLSPELSASKRFDMRCKMISDLAAVLYRNEVDVIVLNDNKSILFKFVIIHDGRIIHEQDHGARVNFELKTMNDYYDFSPFIKAYNQAYMERALK